MILYMKLSLFAGNNNIASLDGIDVLCDKVPIQSFVFGYKNGKDGQGQMSYTW